MYKKINMFLFGLLINLKKNYSKHIPSRTMVKCILNKTKIRKIVCN